MLSRFFAFCLLIMFRFAGKSLMSVRAIGGRSFATYFSKDHEWIEVLLSCDMF